MRTSAHPFGGRSAFRTVAVIAVFLAGCGGGGNSTNSGPTPPPTINNVQPVDVNFGPAQNLINGLFTSVTVCVPGTNQCQTIPDVQVDTGSVGLRLFASQLQISLPAIKTSSGATIANCVSFADMTYLWGSVATADVQMAGETASAVPIQLAGAAGLPPAPDSCTNGGPSANSVSDLGANGLLGIGVFRQDCGPACESAPLPPFYYTCSGSTAASCATVPVGLGQQLQNPVWLFPQDNNGLLVSLPSISPNGAPGVSGSLIFGIGTQPNNGLGSAQVYTTDDVGEFTTVFQGHTLSGSLLDTGSNGLYFLDAPTIGIPACSGQESAFSCPTQTLNLTATNTGANGVSGNISFSVANALQLFATGNSALNDLGGPDSGDFDWGISFFYGRNVFIGIEGQLSPGGTGPYWAY